MVYQTTKSSAKLLKWHLSKLKRRTKKTFRDYSLKFDVTCVYTNT